MATTVNYKGQTLTTVENQTKTLETKGTWMEDDLTLTDVSGGGSPDHWVRPSDWPDLSQLDRSGEVVYITCDASEECGYITLEWRTSYSNKADVSIGDIVNGQFVPEETWTDFSGKFSLYFGNSLGGYKVFRVTPKESYHLQGINVGEYYEQGQYTNDFPNYPSKAVLGWWSGVLEVYGNMPSAIYEVSARTCQHIQAFDVTNIKPNTMTYAFNSDKELHYVNTSTWDMSTCTTLERAFSECGMYSYFEVNGIEDWELPNVANMGYMFYRSGIKGNFDMTNWDLPKVNNMQYMFADCLWIESVKLMNSDVACNCNRMFVNSKIKSVDFTEFDSSLVNNIGYMFDGCSLLGEVEGFESLDMSSVTTASNSQNLLNGARPIESLTIPASLTIIGNQAFANMEMCKEYHFLATTPPTLNNTNAFPNLNQRITKKIYVPYSADHSVLTAYQTATNWSTFASYMVEESA